MLGGSSCATYVALGGWREPSLVPNAPNFGDVSNGYGRPDSWFESGSLRQELRFSDHSAFLVSDISFLADIWALFRSARRAALCTETNLGVIGLGGGLWSPFPF
jgi:hypothetical protein